METIKRKDMLNDGVFINLETSYKPYINLLNNHYKYLDKNNKYYIWCKTGKKAKNVASVLEAYGYNVVLVIN